MFRFSSVSSLGARAIEDGQSFAFTEGINSITDYASDGDTLIFDRLREQYIAYEQSQLEHGIIVVPVWLVCCQEYVVGFHGGVPYRPLAELLQQAAVRQHQAELEEEIANGLVFILQEKWNQPSKFGCLAGDNPEFLVSIDSRGAIDIALKQSGERISHLFQSMGESTVLFLALSGATRRVLDTDIPFVMSGLGAFDRHLVGPCREFIAGMANQIVVFEDYWQGECG